MLSVSSVTYKTDGPGAWFIGLSVVATSGLFGTTREQIVAFVTEEQRSPSASGGSRASQGMLQPTEEERHLETSSVPLEFRWHAHCASTTGVRTLAERISRNHTLRATVERLSLVRPLHRVPGPANKRPDAARNRCHGRGEWRPRFEAPIDAHACGGQRIESHPVPIGENRSRRGDLADDAPRNPGHDDTSLGDLTGSSPPSPDGKRRGRGDAPHTTLRLGPVGPSLPAIPVQRPSLVGPLRRAVVSRDERPVSEGLGVGRGSERGPLRCAWAAAGRCSRLPVSLCDIQRVALRVGKHGPCRCRSDDDVGGCDDVTGTLCRRLRGPGNTHEHNGSEREHQPHQPLCSCGHYETGLRPEPPAGATRGPR